MATVPIQPAEMQPLIDYLESLKVTPAASEPACLCGCRRSSANVEFQTGPPRVVVGHQSSGNRAALHSDGIHLPVDRRH